MDQSLVTEYSFWYLSSPDITAPRSAMSPLVNLDMTLCKPKSYELNFPVFTAHLGLYSYPA